MHTKPALRSRPSRGHVSLGRDLKFVGKIVIPKRTETFRVDSVFSARGGSSAGVSTAPPELRFGTISDEFQAVFGGRTYEASSDEPAAEQVVDCHCIVRSMLAAALFRTLRDDGRRLSTLAEVAAVLKLLDQPSTTQCVREQCRGCRLHWFCLDTRNTPQLVCVYRPRSTESWSAETDPSGNLALGEGDIVFTHGRPV